MKEKLNLTKILASLLICVLCTTQSGCKKEKDTEPPSLDGTWKLVSLKENGTEKIGVWKEYFATPSRCITNPNIELTCFDNKSRLASSQMVLLDDKTYVWGFTYEDIDLNNTKSRQECRCIYEDLYRTTNSYAGSWYTSSDDKTLMQKDNGSSTVLDTYTIGELTNTRLLLISKDNQDTYEYLFEK